MVVYRESIKFILCQNMFLTYETNTCSYCTSCFIQATGCIQIPNDRNSVPIKQNSKTFCCLTSSLSLCASEYILIFLASKFTMKKVSACKENDRIHLVVLTSEEQFSLKESV